MINKIFSVMFLVKNPHKIYYIFFYIFQFIYLLYLYEDIRELIANSRFNVEFVKINKFSLDLSFVIAAGLFFIVFQSAYIFYWLLNKKE